MKHIIIAEDDESVNLSVLCKLLAEGNDVRAYKSGEAALQALDEGLKPDLILLDIMMPSWMALPHFLKSIKTRIHETFPSFSSPPWTARRMRTGG